MTSSRTHRIRMHFGQVISHQDQRSSASSESATTTCRYLLAIQSTIFTNNGHFLLQVCKQLSALTKKKTARYEQNLDNLREIMGVMQHHDAVSGTEKQHVANDYARLLQIGIEKCGENIQGVLNELTIDDEDSQIKRDDDFDANFKFDYANCAELNISACAVTENSEKFMVTLYNPLAHSTFQYVRVPVRNADYEILDYRNVPVPSQIVTIPSSVATLPFRQSTATSELVFMASELPPLGYKSYFVQKKSTEVKTTMKTVPMVMLVQDEMMSDEPFTDLQTGPVTIGNQYLNLTFDENGLLSSAATPDVEMKVRQNFLVYEAFLGNNEVFDNRSSGAYIFRPNVTKAADITRRADIQVIKGDLVDEVHQVRLLLLINLHPINEAFEFQTFNEWISQVVRIYKHENYAEFQWMIGSIPVEDGIGREIITRFDTDIESNGVFYTDSNGREMLKRTRDQRDTWNLTLLEKVSGNYYPVTTKLAIEDINRRFALLTDRAVGGSSLEDGSVELMVRFF